MSAALKVALLGYGYAGKTLHAPLISSLQNFELVAVCSSDATKVHADFPLLKVSRSLDDLLSTTPLDAIVIATPNHTHFDLARTALLAGKHVVVDKPFTVTAAQARELKVLAVQKNLILSVFHNRRWDADFLTLRELIVTKELGALHSFESRFDRYRPEVRARWREQAGDGSGLWYDLGPHLLDQAVQLFGRPLAIHADFAMQRDHAQTIDFFQVSLRYQNLRVSLCASMLVATETPRYVLIGELGRYTKYGLDMQEEALKRGELPGERDWGYDPKEGMLRVQNITHSVANLRGDYRCFYAAFHDAILCKAANPVSLDDAVLTMELIELAYESAQQGVEKNIPPQL